MSSEDPLACVRERIDAIDQEILRLISERAACAKAVAGIKSDAGHDQFYRPEREAAILRQIKQQNPGPLDGEEVARLFREIMSACLALEQTLQVAFLGPAGTFTQAAAIKHFGHAVGTIPLGTITDIFREVEAGSCQYGVVPVENSTEGVIMSGEPELSAVRTVFSHQQSLAQCRGWLDRHLPHAERVGLGSNAEAARMAVEQPGSAAVAGEAAAEIYGLQILAARIEDEPGNTTRFLVIGAEDAPPSGRDKTSLLFSCRNEAGALHRLLTPFATHGISMTRIESRPSRRAVWDYVFFVDIQGHRDDQMVAGALELLRQESHLFKILGSYPEAVI
ncbi:MAG: chorismate mutase [Chromatiaceae bacterium]